MRIGIDIDNTLVNTNESYDRVIKKYNLDFNKDYKELYKTWTKEERDYIFKNYLQEILKDATFKDGAIDALKKLNDLGNELYIITARRNHYSPNLEEETLKVINDNGLNIKKVYFGQDKKSDIAKNINIDLMIDDDENVYKNMKLENIDCILYGDKIKTWEDVLKYIEERDKI